MRRRSVAVILAAGLVALAACGDDDARTVESTAATTPTTSTAPTTPPVPAGDGPFIEVERRIVVSADGHVYRREAEQAGFAPPIPDRPAAWEMATLTADGWAELLAIVEGLGFLEPPPDYGDLMVSDTDPFRLVVTTDGTEHVHELFMPDERLGDAEADAARDRLAELVGTLDDLDTVLGDGLSDFAPYLPDGWRLVEVRRGGTEAPPWPFEEPAVEGCTAFEGEDVTAGGHDAATGRYGDPSGSDDLDVDALLPWETC